MFIIGLFIGLGIIQEIPGFIAIGGAIGAVFFTAWSMEKTKKYLDSLNPTPPEEAQGILLGCILMAPIIVFLDNDIRKFIDDQADM